MNIRYLDNLMFQKREFPDIYKSYNSENYSYNNGVKQGYLSFKKNIQYLYIRVDIEFDLLNLISNLFHASLNYDKTYDTCVLVYGIENGNIEAIDENGNICITLSHPYLNKNSSVIFSKILNDNLLNMSSDFKTYYSNGQMKMLDELRIKKLFGYTFENDNFSSLDEMKNYIRDFEPEYGIKLIENNINKKLKFEDLTGLCDKISLNIIQVINDNWSESDDSIYNKCLYMTQEFYSVCSKEIVRENLQMGSLEDNFVCVEKYFRYMDEIKKNIADYYKKKIMPSVREYRKQFKGYATLHNCLSNDAGILGMDNYVQEDLRRLMKILEAE